MLAVFASCHLHNQRASRVLGLPNILQSEIEKNQTLIVICTRNECGDKYIAVSVPIFEFLIKKHEHQRPGSLSLSTFFEDFGSIG